MSRRGWIWGGGAVAALGLFVLILVLATQGGSPRGFVEERYTFVSADGDSRTYRDDRPPTAVANEIADRWKPIDRIVDPSGHYLRYSDDYVAVLPAVGGGSTIAVDDERTGYTRWYPIVGGTWGSYSGSTGGGFRGGGPGTGK